MHECVSVHICLYASVCTCAYLSICVSVLVHLSVHERESRGRGKEREWGMEDENEEKDS